MNHRETALLQTLDELKARRRQLTMEGSAQLAMLRAHVSLFLRGDARGSRPTDSGALLQFETRALTIAAELMPVSGVTSGLESEATARLAA